MSDHIEVRVNGIVVLSGTGTIGLWTRQRPQPDEEGETEYLVRAGDSEFVVQVPNEEGA